MSSKLPPYSTYRTDKTQCMVPQAVSHGNILTFTPRGFRQTLNVKFPDSRLAVCEKCKRNYKTRDSCRVRSGHTSEPWTTAFICVTVDDSCTDANGNYVDKPMTVRMVQWQPYCVKEDFEKKTPVCAACKKTNRTRSFCRVRHKHKQLPWCTVFVILSTVDSTDPSTVVAQPSIPVEYHENSIYSFAPHPPKPQKSFDGIPTDDINAIESSRTFLCKISCTHSSIHWLEYNDTEGGGPTNNERDVKALNEAIRTPGAGAPPPVMDANQQYYQMTQQAMQQQAFLHQHGHQHQPGHPHPPHGHVPHGRPAAPYGWYPPPPPPPSHMMPPMGAVMNPDGTATQTNPNMAAVPGTADLNGDGSGVNPVNMDRKDQPDVKEDEDGNGTTPAVDPNAAYQQQAWHAQMMYQQQLYQQQHQMYAQQPPQPQYGSPGGTGMESARGGPNEQGAQAQHTYGTYQDSAPAPVAQQNFTPNGSIAADHHQLHSAQQQQHQPQHQQQEQQQQVYQDHEQNAGQSLLQMQYPLPMQDPSQPELFSSPNRGGVEHLNGGDAVNGDELPISTGNDIDVKVVDDKSNGNDNAISTDSFVPMFSNPSFQTNSGIGVDDGPIHGDDIQPNHTDGDFKKEDKIDTSVGLDVGGADPPVKRLRVDSPV
eukprot:CAMPEP_0194118834 /NCGR_PEP_ID=MMETSP0150-20130528/37153_1 /TAXON_ID=122233 /ORGANISM="Chaetoceros debilis, Strain MM31A-1" /LENGTH=648 /DNA_ID=CAMNT_0038810357 /DNA_START=172 /DNA_END=2114 /DNA_ORIENTATION=-